MVYERTEKDELCGKILKALCEYSDILAKQGRLADQKIVQDCLAMVHEAYYDDWGQPRENSIDAKRSFRTDVTEGYVAKNS